MPCANNLNCTSTLMKILSQNLAAHVERTKIWQKSICMKVIPETSPNVLFDFTHKINESGVCSKEKTGFFFCHNNFEIFQGKSYISIYGNFKGIIRTSFYNNHQLSTGNFFRKYRFFIEYASEIFGLQKILITKI